MKRPAWLAEAKALVKRASARREGQALVEYALILLLVVIAAFVALHLVGTVTGHSLNNTAQRINGA